MLIHANSSLRHPLRTEKVVEFYESDVVIETFNEGFAGRWHTRVVPDAPGPKSSEEYIASLLGLNADQRILDFGCGVGVVACSLAHQIGCSVRGLNVSAKQVGLATQIAESLGVADRAAFDLYAGGSFPYPDETFDGAMFLESPCHVPDKASLVRELFRVLRPGGVCAGQDWAVTSGTMSETDYADWILPIESSCEVTLLSLEAYKQLFLEAGFVNVRVFDARDIYAGFAASFTRPSHSVIRVDPADSIAERLAKGNVALSNAFHRSLFTVGFVRGDKPPCPTRVRNRVRPDGTDFDTGTRNMYSADKNVSVIEYHKKAFGVPSDPWLRAFEALARGADRATVEASCKVSGDERHSARFNLFFHDNQEDGYARIRDYIDHTARETQTRLDMSPVDEFVGSNLDFARISKVVTGIDLRSTAEESRLKIWFMLSEYAERVERAIDMQGGDSRVRAVVVGGRFLVGFDLHLDGRSTIKVYPDIKTEDLTNLRILAAFSEDTLQAMRECPRIHVYVPRPGSPFILQFHPRDPDDFIERRLRADLAGPIHRRYQGRLMLDMVVALREADVATRAAAFSLYYMPGDELLA